MMHFWRAFADSARRNARTGSSPGDAAKNSIEKTFSYLGRVTCLLRDIKANGGISSRVQRTIASVHALHRCDERATVSSRVPRHQIR